ncbi:hypothetical protein M2140_000203 [Clostridiales Family XIII bacterium PM5-7]
MKKKVYVVVSRTNTLVGKVIRIMTKFEYNHVSVSLCEDIQPMFSFARYRGRSFWRGGFVEESWLRYLYQGKDVSIKVFELETETENYEKIKNEIVNMMENAKDYRYDFSGLLFKKHQQDNNKTCLSFATEILKMTTGNPQLEFKNIELLCMYLNQYLTKEDVIKVDHKFRFTWGNDTFHTS